MGAAVLSHGRVFRPSLTLIAGSKRPATAGLHTLALKAKQVRSKS